MTRYQQSNDLPLAVQSGAALIMCLVLLGALSLLGLSAASEHRMQLHMSHNLESSLERRINADHALKWAEDWLLGLPGNNRPLACSTDCSSGDLIRVAGAFGPTPQYMDPSWWQHNGHAAGYTPGAEPPGFSGPWYIVQEVYLEPSSAPESLQQETSYYRILAQGSAANEHQSSVTESILARPWGHESLSNGFPSDPLSVSFCKSDLVEPPCGRVAWRWLKQ